MDGAQIESPPMNSSADAARKIPKLFDLSIAAFYQALLFNVDYFAEGLLSLPAYFCDLLLSGMPPAGLLKLEQNRVSNTSFDDQEDAVLSCSNSKKRKIFEPFNDLWKTLCYQRFPQPLKLLGRDCMLQKEFDDNDWLQLYWQNHIQECLDDVGRCEQPFQTGASSTKVSDDIMGHTFYEWIPSDSEAVYYKLAYHCEQYGQYARCLRIESSMCVPEICDLLKNCELRTLVFNFFLRSKEVCQVDALCELLKQNARSLRSLTLCVCNLSSSDLKRIYNSLYLSSIKSHMLEDLNFSAAMFKKPTEFTSFLGGRFLRSICFSSINADRNFAKNVFTILLKNSSPVSVLDLSRNMISGWLSSLSQNKRRSLSSLRSLKLRGACLNSSDISDLKYAMSFIPNLESLDLSENDIKDEGIKILASCITDMAERNCFLKHLALDHCRFTHAGCIPLLLTLSSLEKPVIALSVADNELGWGIAEPLARLINKSLVNLEIPDIRLPPLGFDVLSREINDNLKLETINLSNNFGGSAVCELTLKLLSNAPKLCAIKIVDNGILPNAIKDLCSSLKKTKGNLSKVDITGQRFKKPFLNLLESHPQFESPSVMLESDSDYYSSDD